MDQGGLLKIVVWLLVGITLQEEVKEGSRREGVIRLSLRRHWWWGPGRDWLLFGFRPEGHFLM